MAKNLQLILREDIPTLGKSGEIVKVRAGFARNFLIPRGFAVGATEGNVSRIEHEKKLAEKRTQKIKAENKLLSDKLNGLKISIPCAVGDGQKLFGSVTTRDIQEALKAERFDIDRRLIETDPLKSLGDHAVRIRLDSATSVTIQVSVTAKK